MITENLGVRFTNGLTDTNKHHTGTNGSATHSQISEEAEDLKLDDAQIVRRAEHTEKWQPLPSANKSPEALAHMPDSSRVSQNEALENLKKMLTAANETVLKGKPFSASGEPIEQHQQQQSSASDSGKLLKAAENTGTAPADETAKTTETANTNAAGKAEHKKHDQLDPNCPECSCQTCKNRRYQDGSDDSGVSFQQPTAMDPTTAQYRVKGHEMEHVRREQMKAKEEDRKIVAQSVQIKTDICPECGKLYVAGGVTRTVSQAVNGDFYNLFRVGAEDNASAEEMIG